MAEPREIAAVLDEFVDAGRLIGYVCGVRQDGHSRLAAGGTRSMGGAPMREDAVFPLSSNTKPIAGILAMRLVERGVIALDDPVEAQLPELAWPRVLAEPDGPLDRTVPAERPVTVRDLLTMTAGVGWPVRNPALGEAMAARGVAPGPYAPAVPPGEYLRRLAELPFAGQPGGGWWYHTCSDVLGVLLARATGASVGELVVEHVTGPLGLADTGFTADPYRLVVTYGLGPDGRVAPADTATRFTGRPVFDSLACGLAGTVRDYLTVLDVLVDGGPLLDAESVRLMTSDHLTERQRASAEGFLEPGCGYGFQVEVRPDGTVGWAGGLGTIGYVDRRAGRSAAVFTAQAFDVPGTAAALEAVWSLLD